VRNALARRSAYAARIILREIGNNDYGKSSLGAPRCHLETEVAQLKIQLAKPQKETGCWLDDIFAAFDNDPIYAEAIPLVERSKSNFT
jgi:hypothetical protein